MSGTDPGPARVGLVSPSSNPTFEPEVTTLLPGALLPHAARFPAHPGLDLAERLTAYVGDLPEVMAGFGDLPLTGVLVGCTGSSYALGPDGDVRWAEEASAATGLPTLTAAAAILRALQSLGRDQLLLVSPYPAWLTRQCADYWTAQGYDIAGITPLPPGSEIYTRSAAEVYRAIKEAVREHRHDPRRTAVLMTGTGAPSLPALDAATWFTDLPLLSSNLAGAWALTVDSGQADPAAAPGSALHRLYSLTADVKEANG